MRTDKLNYNLPKELIAQQPSDIRSDSRLLVYHRSDNRLTDSQFSRLKDFLLPGDCLVLNDTKVIQARFFAHRRTSGRLEGLFLRESEPGVWEVMLKGSRKVKTGEVIYLQDKTGADFCNAELLSRLEHGICRLSVENKAKPESVLEKIGFAPLPPYIKRTDNLSQAAIDKLRYQTVYARQAGAVAAPTAGLHFTEDLLEQLKDAGIYFAYITLHVGEGTFKPVKAENLEEHKIHSERFGIDEENVRIINTAKERNGRIIAVGTTSVRVLETVAAESRVSPVKGTTDLFIRPGYKFKMVDAMITNFHLPRSTLLALVAAFAGLENILSAYKHAVEKRYRFYSYGDAMFIV